RGHPCDGAESVECRRSEALNGSFASQHALSGAIRQCLEAPMRVNARLSLCAMLLALAACGGDGSSEQAPPQANANPPTPETPTPPAPPPTTPDPPTPADPPPPPDPDPETPPSTPVACTQTDTAMAPGTAPVAQCANTQYDVLTNVPYATGGSHLLDLY